MINYDVIYLLDDNFLLSKKENEKYVLKNLKSNKYYILDSVKLSKILETNSIREFICRKLSYKEYVFLLLGICFFIQNFYFSDGLSIKVSASSIIFSSIWLLINVIIHELGHIYFVKRFGGEISRYGFTVKYLLPAFYVDTSDSFLFSKKKRFIIYSAGCINNVIFNGIFGYILIKSGVDLQLGYISVFYMVVFNIIPLLNTDGCNIFFLVMNAVKIDKKVISLNNNNKTFKTIFKLHMYLDNIFKLFIAIRLLISLIRLVL